MAGNRPMAVVTSASETPGTTIASVACCTFPSELKAFMMPQTVPNRPTYGLVEPTVASVARLCSSRSISLSCATRIARRAPSSSMSAATPPCARSRANSRKPNSKMLSMPVALPRDSMARYSELRSPPDQKLFSNRSASRCARCTTRLLRKIIAHDISEAASRMPMTTCTTRLAWTIMLRIDKSPPISYSLRQRAAASCRQLPDYDWRQAPGFQRSRVQAGNAHRGTHQQILRGRVAPDALLELKARPALPLRLAADRQHIVEPRRATVLRFQGYHREHYARIACQRQLRHPVRPQPLTACTLQESQIIRIINNASGVGVFPIHTRLPHEGGQAP